MGNMEHRFGAGLKEYKLRPGKERTKRLIELTLHQELDAIALQVKKGATDKVEHRLKSIIAEAQEQLGVALAAYQEKLESLERAKEGGLIEDLTTPEDIEKLKKQIREDVIKKSGVTEEKSGLSAVDREIGPAHITSGSARAARLMARKNFEAEFGRIKTEMKDSIERLTQRAT